MERKATLLERVSAMIVALAMLFSMMPVQAFADNIAQKPETTAAAQVQTADTQKGKVAAAQMANNVEGSATSEGRATTTNVSNVTLSETNVALKIGESKTLTATVEPTDATYPNVDWNSSAPDIAEVDQNGNITAKAAGAAKITATAKNGTPDDTTDDIIAECSVTVSKLAAAFTVSADNTSVTYGDDVTFTINAAMAGTAAVEIGGQRVTQAVEANTDAKITKAALESNGFDMDNNTITVSFVPTDVNTYEAQDGQTVTVSVAKKEVTVSSWTLKDSEKVYDGNRNFAVDSVTLDGVVEAEKDKVEVDISAAKAAADKADVGTVYVSLAKATLVGDNADHYTVNPDGADKLSATITACPVTLKSITLADKQYDASVAIPAGNATYTFVKQDDATQEIAGLTAGNVTFTAADANAGDNKAVTVNTDNAELTGDGASNYTWDDKTAPKTTVNINVCPVTVELVGTIDKNSDGNSKVTVDADKVQLTATGFPAAESDVIVTANSVANWVYADYLASTGAKKITDMSEDDFTFTLDGRELDKSNYTITFGEFTGCIKSNELNATVDLTQANQNVLELDDSNSVTFTAATATGTDNQLWFTGDNAKLAIESGAAFYAYGGSGTSFAMQETGSGEKNQFEIYVKTIADNKVYGPITVKYAYDNTAPTITADSVKELTIGTHDQNVQYEIGVFDSGSGVDTVEYVVSMEETFQPDNTTKWTSGNLSDGKFTVKAPAKGYVYVRATDKVGKVSDVVTYHPLVVESEKPTATISVDKTTSEKTHTITYKAEDIGSKISGLQTLTFTLLKQSEDGQNWDVVTHDFKITANEAPTTLAAINDVKDWSGTFKLSNDIADGTYKVKLVAKDFCGNESDAVETEDFIIDNTPPEIKAQMDKPVTKIDGAYYYRVDNGGLTVTFTDAHLGDEGGVYTVDVEGADNQKLEQKKLKVQPGDTTGKIEVSAEEIASLNDGTITVTVAATDHAGNSTDKITGDVSGAVVNGLTFQFELDKTPPVLNTVAITDGNYYAGDNKVYYNKAFNVTYTVEDVNYYADGVENTATKENDGPDMALNAKSSDITLSVAKQDDVSNAIYTPKLIIKDKAGNLLVADSTLTAAGANGAVVADGTVTLSNQLVLDTVAPQLTKVESTDAAGHIYAEGVYYQGGFDATFTVEEINYDAAQDGTMGKTVLTVLEDGEAARAGDKRVDVDNTHTVMAAVSKKDTAKTVYSIQLNVVDKAGNALAEVSDANYTNSSDDQPNYTKVENGTATLKNRIMDNVAPVVSISYTDLDATHFYKENDDSAATAYYNKDLTATFAFADAGSLDGSKIFYARSFEGVQDSFGNFDTNKADTNTAPSFDGSTNENLGVKAVDDQNGTYTYTIYGEDKAGNLLTVQEAYDADKNLMGNEASNVGKDNAYTTAPKAMDTVSPTASITYTALDDTHYYKKGDTQVNAYYAYYNRDFTATFAFADTYGTGGKTYNMDQAKLRYTKIKTDDNAKSQDVLNDAALGSGITTPSQTVAYSVTGTADNDHYVFGAYGEDKAGNQLVVTEYNTTSTSGSNQYTAAKVADCKLNYHKVLDTVAPVFTLTVNDPTNDLSIAVDEQNRAFYNGAIEADFVVTDTNLDSGKVKTNTTSRTGSDFNYDTEDVAWAGIDMTKNDPGSPETTVSLSESGTADGIYRFEIEGEDRAGNRLVQSNAEAAVSDFRATLKVGEGRFWTNLKVRDTRAPVLDIELSDGSVFYKAHLGEATQQNNTYYNLQENRPYRQASSATGTLTKTDCSPVSVEYVIDSTTATQTEPGSAYSHDAIGLSMNGEQVFSIAKLVVKDRAGNVSTMPKPGNKIYLDVTAPTEDELAPTVSVVTKESGEGRSVAGRDLFNSNVTVQANVTDPGEGVRSSGLYQVYYQVLVNDADWTDKVSVSGKGSVKAAGIIGYGTSGKDYSSPDAVDETITSQDTINFGFDANTFNYNDVKIYVWAEDNSGNMLTKSEAAHYFFGIDITTPTIEVRYDNNDVQNEKYFKVDRTATVTITERNFDPSQTVMTTESKEISSWTYQPGSMPNGDDDKWIATVGYTQDGDYTFDVSTIDLVGHQAEPADYGDSVAPRAFTIDKTRPIISIRFDNDDVRNGKYYNATRTATVSIEEHNFSNDGVVLTTTADIQEGAVAAPGAGGWSSGGDMNTATVPFTEDGNYTMHVEYTDLAGNEAEPQDVDEFVVDTTAPELTFSINDEAFDEATYTPHAYNGEVVPSITYHDINYDMSGTQMSIVGAKNVDSQILNGAPAEDAMGGVYTCENIAETPENDDVYTCTGKVVDMAGNESTVDFVFSVNRYGSNYILSEATQQLVDNYYTNQAPDLGVTEINVNTLKSKEITYALNGDIKTLEPNTEYSVQESGTETSWKQYDYNIFSSNFTQEGIYDITIYSEDEAGNANSNHTERVKEYSKNISFVLDQTAPSITISGVEEDGRYDTDTRLISVGYSENFAIDTITITNGDKTDSYTADQLNATGDTLEFEVPASNSKQTVTVTAADKAGNTVTVESPRFLLTSNKLIQFVNNTPLLVASILLLVLIVLAIIDYLRKGFLYMLLHKKKSESKN